MNPEEAQARRRFAVISLVRLGGAATAVFGLVILAGRLDWPPLAGAVFVLAGLAGFAVLPRSLARKWKTKQE